MAGRVARQRLLVAERQGLKLAIICRTAAVAFGMLWLTVGWNLAGFVPSPLAMAALALFGVIGIASYTVIGTRYERSWLKYALYAIDILAVCAVFVVIPVSRFAPELPQVLAFRAFGVHYLFPLVAMACLTLSWRLVAWSGLAAVAGWWAAFGLAIADMQQRLSWRDLPIEPTADEYLKVFLSPDFVGYGTRLQETVLLMIAALVLALADRDALAPQVRHGVALVLDIENFTAYADGRAPEEVIATLGAFLARSAEAISNREGVVISFTGDGLLAAFNTPLEIAKPERAALDAASDLLKCAEAAGFRVRIGLAAGQIASGRVGSDRRQAFTIYGDTVNRAARLEVLAKDVGVTVLADAGVAGKAKPDDLLKPLGEHRIRGFEAPLAVWSKELTALPGV